MTALLHDAEESLAIDAAAADILFREAPTAKNGQPLGVILVRSDEARERSARFNATLQAGSFILAVRAAGQMGGFDAAGVDRDLLGDGPLKSLPVVNIGTPAEGGTFPRNPRLAYDEVVTSM